MILSQPLTLHTDPRGIATLTLTRPEKHNALSGELIASLRDAAEVLGRDQSVRAVVLTGAGESFCAGGDLGWMRAQVEADRETRVAEARRLADMLGALNGLPKPLIGRINGQAFGGGVGLIAVCDVAIAINGARFGLTETRLGLIPATISPYVVARMGEGRARAVFLSGRRFDAQEAAALGLVHRVVASEALDAAVETEAAACLAAAPGAMAAAKSLVRSLGPRIDAAVVEDTVSRLADTWETPEAREGIAAFFERRPAFWTERQDEAD